MSTPLIHAFFVGRAFAELVSEQFEQIATNALSDLGRFDAEQRERLRQFTDQVMERASQAEAAAAQTGVTAPTTTSGDDLQAMLDELRAEIAQLRTELQRYRSRSV